MTHVRYEVVPGAAGAKLVKASVKTALGMTALIREITELARSNTAERAPVGWSGALRGGYATEVRRANTAHPVGILSNPIIYHDPVEEGRHAGKPPPTAALVPWVGSKLGIPPGPERESVAFLVARKIGQKGTEGQHMVEEGWKETRAAIAPRLKDLGLRIVAQLK